MRRLDAGVATISTRSGKLLLLGTVGAGSPTGTAVIGTVLGAVVSRLFPLYLPQLCRAYHAVPSW